MLTNGECSGGFMSYTDNLNVNVIEEWHTVKIVVKQSKTGVIIVGNFNNNEKIAEILETDKNDSLELFLVCEMHIKENQKIVKFAESFFETRGNVFLEEIHIPSDLVNYLVNKNKKEEEIIEDVVEKIE